jgi:hypothetical protein
MVRQRGQVQTRSHTSVLQALSHHSGNSYVMNITKERDWSIDETGMLDTSGLDICKENDIFQQEISKLNAIPVQEEVLHIHGFAPPKKAEGNVCLIYENINRLNTRLRDNEKVERMKEIHDKLEIDIAAYCEHKINFRHRRNVNGFNQLVKGGKALIQSIVAHNVHENVGRIQRGGTSLLLFGHLTQQFDPNESKKDPTGLGRWSVMTLQGDGVQTCIICGYNPCGNNKLHSGTSYQQQRRFFVITRRDSICQWKHFHDNLLEQLTMWQEEGDRLRVCMDANEDIYRKLIGQSLTNLEGLNMREVVGEFTGQKIGPTFF